MSKRTVPAAGGAMPARKPPKKRASPPSSATSEAQAPRASGGDVSEAKAEASTAALKANGKPAAPGAADPIFAAIAEWRAEQKKIIGSDVDVDGKHYADLTNKLFATAPTSTPGILAMIEVFLDEDNEDDPRFLLKSIAAVLKPLAASA
jgi:hypothetical protein